jgi:hypothetical protein
VRAQRYPQAVEENLAGCGLRSTSTSCSETGVDHRFRHGHRPPRWRDVRDSAPSTNKARSRGFERTEPLTPATRLLASRPFSIHPPVHLPSDGADAPPTASKCQGSGCLRAAKREASMAAVSIIGLDLVWPRTCFRRMEQRRTGRWCSAASGRDCRCRSFFADAPRCTVAMEACTSAHHRAQAIAALGQSTHDTQIDE